MTKNRASTVGDALFLIGVGIYALAGFLVPASVDLRRFVLVNFIGLKLAIFGVWLRAKGGKE